MLMFKLCNGEQQLVTIIIIDQFHIILDGKVKIKSKLKNVIIQNQIGLLKNKQFTILKHL